MKSFKNIFNKVMMGALVLSGGLGASVLMGSCTEDDNIERTEAPREFMTMFITPNTKLNDAGKKLADGDPNQCGIDGNYPHGNTIHLYWYGVKDCAGYQIQMASQGKVANGAAAWAKVQGTSDLLLDSIVGPDCLDMVLKDLLYSTTYQFCIRALSTKDRNDKNDPTSFAHASKWWGHGGTSEWQDYYNVQTRDRYLTPFALYKNTSPEYDKEESMRLMINTNLKDVLPSLTDVNDPSGLSETEQDMYESYTKNFNVDAEGNFCYQYLSVQPSPDNPNASVGAEWRYHKITPEERAQGYIDIDGLQKNSTYVIDLIDPTVPVAVDAKYNTLTTRSNGTPGPAILLGHDEMIATYANGLLHDQEEPINRSEVFGTLAAKYNAAPISPVLYDFISNSQLAEGQTFELEGGKTYYIDGNDITCKGFVLRTRPEDVAKGLRAKVICGIGSNSRIYSGTNGDQWQGSYTMFMFGRVPNPGEGGEIYMKKLAFYDIDFDNPTALNYGDNAAGKGVVAGNYFFNMYSTGMAVTLDSLVIENCEFKRLVRGFVREQGPNYKVWNHVLIKNNLFYDCGYYNQNAGGYPWIAGAGTNAESNLYKDMKVIENTFFDSPFPQFFNETAQANWKSGAWNITFSNNTLINFNTRSAGNIWNMRNLPDGSVFNCQKNLMVLCKKEGDQRVLGAWGADIRNTMTLADGTTGKVTLNFGDNYSTNNDLTNGQIFSGNPWTSTSNNWQKLVKNGEAVLNGSLEVLVDDISATELMEQPCPPFIAKTASDADMHRADALDGSAGNNGANLFFKKSAKVQESNIYKLGIGAARWRK